MADFNSRSDSVDVAQIMQRLRARIRERRGQDDTERQVRELAAARLEAILGAHPASVGLLADLERGKEPAPDAHTFEDASLLGPPGSPLRFVRRLLRPVLRLLVSPDELVRALRLQSDINARRARFERAAYAVIEDLVLETTRLEVEVKRLEMRIESQSARFDFAERRARALEGIVRYRSEPAGDAEGGPRRPPRPQPQRQQPQPPRPPAPAPRQQPPGEPAPEAPAGETAPAGEGDTPAGGTDSKRRRRRRRGRRGGTSRPAGEGMTGGGAEPQAAEGTTAGAEPQAGSPAPDTREREDS